MVKLGQLFYLPSNQMSQILHNRRSTWLRRWRENLLLALIRFGGISVLLLLLTMFVYMMYVTLPLLQPLGFERLGKIEKVSNHLHSWYSGSDELYQLDSNGNIWQQGKQQQVSFSGPVVSVNSHSDYVIAKLSTGYLEVLNLQTGELSLPFDTQPVDWFAAAPVDSSLKVVASAGQHMLIRQGALAPESFALPGALIEKALLTNDGNQLYIKEPTRISRVKLNAGGKTEKLIDESVADVLLLSGSHSLLTIDQQGNIAQWFDILTEQGRQFVKANQYSANQPFTQLSTEEYRKVFFGLSETGMGIFFAGDQETHFEDSQLFDQASQLSVNSDGTKIAVVDSQAIKLFSINNPYPEVSWHGLWSAVWHENYSQPAYVWQSTTATDMQQAKFSLVPLFFGTVKAAAFAMLFAAPLAVTAAIYSGYFSSSQTRNSIRPLIEMMEALPTVIIGLIAAVWLAPFFERYLVPSLLFLMFLPGLIILFAYVEFNFRHRLPEVARKLPKVLLLLPILILSLLASLFLAPVIESWLMSEHKVFYQGLLSSQQDNAFILAIALGFAVIPTIYTIAEDAVFNVPKKIVNGSLALGANRWQTFKRIIIKMAFPGILAALMMGFGRAVGETMIVLMATGNSPVMDWDLLQGMRTITATISMEMPEASQADAHFKVIFLVALLLFIVTSLFNSMAEMLRQYMRSKYGNM